MDLKNRKLEVYRFRGEPTKIYIDIMQIDGDCPLGYPESRRSQCPCDSQNTLASFVYDVVSGRIVLEGALTRGKWSTNLDMLIKHGYDPLRMEPDDFIRQIKGELSYDTVVNRGIIIEVARYRGDEISRRPLCEFTVADFISSSNADIAELQDMIRANPKATMREGGIEFHGPGGSIITYRSDGNVRE